jgi:hypothetical protein
LTSIWYRLAAPAASLRRRWAATTRPPDAYLNWRNLTTTRGRAERRALLRILADSVNVSPANASAGGALSARNGPAAFAAPASAGEAEAVVGTVKVSPAVAIKSQRVGRM